MIFRKAEKEDFYKIRSLYWTLIDQEQDDPSFPHWKKGIHPSDEMIQDSIDRDNRKYGNTEKKTAVIQGLNAKPVLLLFFCPATIKKFCQGLSMSGSWTRWKT